MRGGRFMLLLVLVAVARAASGTNSGENGMNTMRALKSSAGASRTPPAPGFTRLENSALSTVHMTGVCALLAFVSLFF